METAKGRLVKNRKWMRYDYPPAGELTAFEKDALSLTVGFNILKPVPQPYSLEQIESKKGKALNGFTFFFFHFDTERSDVDSSVPAWWTTGLRHGPGRFGEHATYPNRTPRPVYKSKLDALLALRYEASCHYAKRLAIIDQAIAKEESSEEILEHSA
ncbi:hypothetical protein EHO57_14220 [Leptospira langatensis]|uniref:Uncharacterized protein n=1 Tax=Leptospira langatensis TaxID=2484983 RepID=A0A5R2ATL7_9LEPT|nr:hypothetical protein [Leptospira langatensis]TGJ99910.1 hypothetical protein EHO57_14220 [Leptospira langatensis]